MKRILFVDHTPFVGGAQLVLADHIRHLDRTRFVPLVACSRQVPSLAERYRMAGAEVHLIPIGRLRTTSTVAILRLMHAAWTIRGLIRREKVEIVVANTSRAAYVCSLAVLGTGVPLIWWVRDFLYGRRLFRRLQRIPKKIICVSRAIRDYYGGNHENRFAVVYVGNDLHRRLDGVSAAALRTERERWGIRPTDVVVGFMGRLVAEKGPEDVVAAIEELHAEYPHLKLLVVGTGGEQQGDVEERLRHDVSTRGLGYIVFAGHQTDEALYYQLFDVFVLSTRAREPFATSVVQAMMAGKPVVATSTGGTPEIVFDNETGLLVRAHAPGEIAQALRRLLEDQELTSRIARAGQKYVLQRNREEITTAQIEKLYSEIF